MAVYALRRLAGAIPVLLFSTFVMFWLTSSLSDPLAALAQACPQCDQSAYDRLTDLYELDKPIPERYASWLGDALQGDLGRSTSMSDVPVSEVFWARAKNSAILAVPAAVIVILMSAMLAIYSGLHQYSRSDYAITAITYLGLGMPAFLLALVLQVFWGVWWPEWTGTKPFWTGGLHTESFGQLLSSATLPVATIIFLNLSADTRFGRAAILDMRNAEFIRTARAKGVPERTIVFKHLLRAALVPMVTVWSLTFGGLLAGTIVVETIFSWPGLGRLLVFNGVQANDVNVVMAVTSFLGLLAVFFNLLADLLYGWLDPRVRYG